MGSSVYPKPTPSRGFTLLEIMVALAILALSGVALLGKVNQSIRGLSDINDRSIALSIAESKLNELLMLDEALPIGNKEDIMQFGGREWYLDVEVSTTGNTAMQRIDISITERDGERGAEPSNAEPRRLLTLSGFKRQDQ